MYQGHVLLARVRCRMHRAWHNAKPHRHARKIGIWVAAFVASPYISPLFGNFIIAGLGEWRPVFWVVFATCCLDLGLVVLFMDETYYNRDVPLDAQPERGGGQVGRIMRVLGVWEIRHHSNYYHGVIKSNARMVKTLFKPVIFPCCVYYLLSFMWSVGINITSTILFELPVEIGGYGFGPRAVGYLYFTPIVGVIIGESFGHFFNDFLARRYIKRHDGHFKPETRLWTNYISAALMIPGLVILGQALDHHWNYWVIVVGWCMYIVGVMTATVGITAYALDSYPSASGEVAGLLNVSRTIGGFAVGYFQAPVSSKISSLGRTS